MKIHPCVVALLLCCCGNPNTTSVTDAGPDGSNDLRSIAPDTSVDGSVRDTGAIADASLAIPDASPRPDASLDQGRCGPGFSECGGECVNLLVDVDHCGFCGNKCDFKTTQSNCNAGKCMCRKPYGDPTPLTWCDGECADAQTAAEHCGACDNACPKGSSCEDGKCSVCGDGVATGDELCDGDDLRGRGCFGSVQSNVLSCKNDCTLDTSACTCVHPTVTESCTSGWCKIPAGCFDMGSPPSEPCRGSNETLHQVTFRRPFKIAQAPVTQAQFAALLGYQPTGFAAGCDDCPAAVWWHGAAAYCNKLSKDSGLTPCYSCATETKPGANCSPKTTYSCSGYRLPTEAEWEYAYRAGTKTAYYSGTNDPAQCSGKDGNADLIGWYADNASGQKQPVKTKQPNAWGLYDMAGNTWEWTHDNYDGDPGTWPMLDPVGGGTPEKVIRGGSFSSVAGELRAAQRSSQPAGVSSPWVGFRCVRVL